MAREGAFSIRHHIQTGSGAHWVSVALSPVVKNSWSYTSTPPIRFHGVVVKHRDNYTFAFTTL
jgi:hypothetical protein